MIRERETERERQREREMEGAGERGRVIEGGEREKTL